MSDRKGDWIQTYTGKKFWPLDPRPEDVDIEDIAHALSMTCRFGGHCVKFYSVAEHSALVSAYVPPEYALEGLLHDATEAYLVDLSRPIKQFMPAFIQAEKHLRKAIAERFGLEPEEPPIVCEIDRRILTDERNQNMVPSPEKWSTDAEPLCAILEYLSPSDAQKFFLETFARVCYKLPTA